MAQTPAHDSVATQRIDDILATHARTIPDSIFLHFLDQSYSFSDVNASVDAYAEALRAFPCQGRFIGVIAGNTPAFVYAYLAVLRAGGIVVPLNPRLGPEEVAYMLADAHMPLCLCADGCTAVVPQSCTDADAQTHTHGGTSLHFVPIARSAQGTPPTFPACLDECAVCIYTSGTTGRPKGALLTHTALLANARMCAAGLHAKDSNECLVTVLPLFHAFAASACLLQALYSGVSILLIPEFKPVEVLTQMARYNATVFLGVPAMYAVLAQIEAPPEIPSWRLCVSGGAPMSAAIHAAFRARYGKDILEGDGPTECGPATSINPVGGPVKPGTIGVPLPGVEMKIVDDDLQELACGEVGEIAVKSPSNFSAYLNNPDATAETLVNGWVRTGDIGDCDQDGYFRIRDRKKDMILVGGLNVYSQEVEFYLTQHPAILEAAVVGKVDAVRGEVPIAFVVLKPDVTWDDTDVRQFLRERIAGYKIPKEYISIEALPRNATGKVVKNVLRTRVEE